MMDHFIITTQFRILILNDIETMRAGCHDLFDAIIIQYLDILVSHHLEHEFITGTANRVVFGSRSASRPNTIASGEIAASSRSSRSRDEAIRPASSKWCRATRAATIRTNPA